MVAILLAEVVAHTAWIAHEYKVCLKRRRSKSMSSRLPQLGHHGFGHQAAPSVDRIKAAESCFGVKNDRGPTILSVVAPSSPISWLHGFCTSWHPWTKHVLGGASRSARWHKGLLQFNTWLNQAVALPRRFISPWWRCQLWDMGTWLPLSPDSKLGRLGHPSDFTFRTGTLFRVIPIMIMT